MAERRRVRTGHLLHSHFPLAFSLQIGVTIFWWAQVKNSWAHTKIMPGPIQNFPHLLSLPNITQSYFLSIIFHLPYSTSNHSALIKNGKQWTSLLLCCWVPVCFLSSLYCRMLLKAFQNPNHSVRAEPWSLNMKATLWGSLVLVIPVTVTWEYGITISQVEPLFG